MKKPIVFLILWVWVIDSKAQIVGELFTSPTYSRHVVWWASPFADSSRFDFFNYTSFRIGHNSTQKNEFLSYSAINYQLGKGYGIAAGGFVTNSGFSPVLPSTIYIKMTLGL